MKKSILPVIFIISCITGEAQIFKQPVIIETKVHTGMIFPFYEAITYLIKEDIYAYDISLNFPTYGNDYWEKIYRYPRSGIGYSFWNLGNKDILGYAHAIYGFVNIPVLKRVDKYSLNYQVSFGGAYLTKKFDVNENHLNRAISSNTNVYIRLGLDAKIKLFPRCEVILEGGVTHFSNGKTRSPNYGINAGTFSLGLNYVLNKNRKLIFPEPVFPESVKRNINSIVYSAGSKVFDNLAGRRYFISSLSYNFERRLNYKRRIGLGIDMFYDRSIGEALATEDGTLEKDFDKLIRFGLHASHAIQYKKIILGLQLGHYIYSEYTDLSKIYSRISVEYMISTHIFSKIAVKSHLAKADFIEWGIGYSW